MGNSKRYNSVSVKDNCALSAPTPYFRAQAIWWCHLNFFHAAPCCHSNEFWDKSDYNSAPVKDNYLRQGGNVFAGFVCLSVCLWVSKITQTVMDGSSWNFEGMSGMAQATSDSIFAVIRQESWILDHFEIFVSMGLKGNRRCRYGAGTWRTTWHWINVF